MPNPNIPPELEPLREVAARALFCRFERMPFDPDSASVVHWFTSQGADERAMAEGLRGDADAVLLAIAPRIQEMVAAERARCAKFVQDFGPSDDIGNQECAAALRARHAGESPDGR